MLTDTTIFVYFILMCFSFSTCLSLPAVLQTKRTVKSYILNAIQEMSTLYSAENYVVNLPFVHKGRTFLIIRS